MVWEGMVFLNLYYVVEIFFLDYLMYIEKGLLLTKYAACDNDGDTVFTLQFVWLYRKILRPLL